MDGQNKSCMAKCPSACSWAVIECPHNLDGMTSGDCLDGIEGRKKLKMVAGNTIIPMTPKGLL